MIKLSLGTKDYLKSNYKKGQDLLLQPSDENSDYLLIQEKSKTEQGIWIDLPNNPLFSIIEVRYLIAQIDFTSQDQSNLFVHSIQQYQDKMSIYQNLDNENQILIICNSSNDLSKLNTLIQTALEGLKTNKFGKIIKRYNNVEKL